MSLCVGPYRPMHMQDIIAVTAECIVGRSNICNYSLGCKGYSQWGNATIRALVVG